MRQEEATAALQAHATGLAHLQVAKLSAADGADELRRGPREKVAESRLVPRAHLRQLFPVVVLHLRLHLKRAETAPPRFVFDDSRGGRERGRGRDG